MFDEKTKPSSQTNQEPTVKSIASLTEIFTELLKLGASQVTSPFPRVLEYEGVMNRLSYSFGTSRAFAAEIKASMAGAERLVEKMGGSFSDMEDIIQASQEGLGGLTVLTTRGIEDLYASIRLAEGGLDVTKENAKQIMETSTKAGISVYNIGQQVTTIFNVAKEAGANAKLVFDEIEKNIGSLNLFNFKNGVEGMAKMASTAQMLRIDMQTALNFAENFYDPEKAVELSSVFQRYGMGSLTNIYELQDLARTDPTQLITKLSEDLANFTYFDEEQKRRMLTQEGMDVVRMLGKEISGLDPSKITTMAIAMGEYQSKVKDIALPAWATDKGTQEFLYKQATREEGGQDWGLSVAGIFKKVSDLTEGEFMSYRKMVEEQQKPETDVVEANMKTMDQMTLLRNSIKSLHEFYPRLIASNQSLSNGLNNVAKMLNQSISAPGGFLEKLFGIKYDKKGRQEVTTKRKNLEDITNEIGRDMLESFKQIMDIEKQITTNQISREDGMKKIAEISGQLGKEAMKKILPKEFTENPKLFFGEMGAPFNEMISKMLEDPSSLFQNQYYQASPEPPKIETPSNNTQGELQTAPSSSSINLVQPEPWNININILPPDIDPKIKTIFEQPLITQLTDALKIELSRQNPNSRLKALEA